MPRPRSEDEGSPGSDTAEPLATDTGGHGSLTNAAATGSIWTLVQTILNKVVALLALFALQKFLTKADFGLATTATSIGAFVILLSPQVLGDIYVTRYADRDRIGGAALLLAAVSAGFLALLLAVSAPALERLYESEGLAVVLLFIALRPLADTVQFLPLARMRSALRYREQSRIGSIATCSASVLSVTLAMLGAGAVAVVLPTILALFASGLLYARITGYGPRKVHREEIAPLARTYAVGSLGQYLSNVNVIIESLVVSAIATVGGTGLFGLAFTVATQANSVLAVQVSNVLQPIFVRITDQPVRQAASFMRATRLLSAACVPISLMQAALAPILFALFFEPQWLGCVPIIVMLSIGQCFLFMIMPATALLKAQGRFKAYFLWQSAQLVSGLTLLSMSGLFGEGIARSLLESVGVTPDPDGVVPFAVACAGVCNSAVFLPLAVWIAGRPGRIPARSIARLFLAPWLVTVPAVALVVGAWFGMHAIWPAWIAHTLTLFVVGPSMLVVAIVGCAREHPETWRDFTGFVGRFRARIGR
jgi:O-antigen/teichoic acid export membrane protein